MPGSRKVRRSAAAAPRGTGATIGGSIAILIVWIGGLHPSTEQVMALTTMCAAAVEWVAGRG